MVSEHLQEKYLFFKIHYQFGSIKYLLGSSSLWMKGLVLGLAVAAGTGYLAMPIDIIPDFII